MIYSAIIPITIIHTFKYSTVWNVSFIPRSQESTIVFGLQVKHHFVTTTVHCNVFLYRLILDRLFHIHDITKLHHAYLEALIFMRNSPHFEINTCKFIIHFLKFWAIFLQIMPHFPKLNLPALLSSNLNLPSQKQTLLLKAYNLTSYALFKYHRIHRLC